TAVARASFLHPGQGLSESPPLGSLLPTPRDTSHPAWVDFLTQRVREFPTLDGRNSPFACPEVHLPPRWSSRQSCVNGVKPTEEAPMNRLMIVADNSFAA